MTETDFCLLIDKLLREHKPFAVYRLPGDTRLHLVGAQGTMVQQFEDIENLNGCSGFVIAPFQAKRESPIVLIKGQEEVVQLDSYPPVEPVGASTPRLPRAAVTKAYAERYRLFMQSLKPGSLDKLVLSRFVDLEIEEGFSLAKTFLKAAARYVYSYVYLCSTHNTGTWMGCTPEVLLAGSRGRWQTVALAGTRPLNGGALPTHWDEKNRNEQRVVASYINETLASFGVQAKEEGPYTVRAAELAHLKSDFRFVLPATDRLGTLLSMLHPTPAVCGLRKLPAYDFIVNNEGHDRRYYSGFLGMLNPEGDTNLYVNLRCMQVHDYKLRLYAGGGLLASSTLEEEWEETEDKLNTIKFIVYSL